MTNPKRPRDPNQARSVTELAASADDAAEDQAARIAARVVTFVALALRSEALDVWPTARQYVERAKPGYPDEVRRFMGAVAGPQAERINRSRSRSSRGAALCGGRP